MKLYRLVLVVMSIAMLSTAAFAADPVRVLFDDTHGQSAGNANWLIEGGYSDLADMLKAQGFALDSLKKVSPDGRMTPGLLAGYRALLVPEPNNQYQQSETDAIVAFVQGGGGAFLIADHGGSDRDHDGWDAVKAYNTFVPKFGFQFTGDVFSEAPLSGPANHDHPVMFGVRAVGAWAASTITILPPVDGARVTSLIESRCQKAPYVVAAEAGKGRVVAIGDSSPFDDGTGTGNQKLHDSFDSFMYSHPQFAFNAMTWITGGTPSLRIPSRSVHLAAEAKADSRPTNLLVDAAHGNAASDKMQTFEKHAGKLGVTVYYNLNLLTPDTLAKFGVMFLPNPSLPLLDSEQVAISDWLMAGGRLFVSGDWDSAELDGRDFTNALLSKCGSVIRLNSDQIWDQQHKTNKPWGVLATGVKQGHPVTAGVKTVITWGTCSLMTRDKTPLTASAGVDLLLTSDADAINKDGDRKNDAIVYPSGSLIPIVGVEKLANGLLVVSGCSNFTDYQYPDSDINQSLPGPVPFPNQTSLFFDQLVTWLSSSAAAASKSARTPSH